MTTFFISDRAAPLLVAAFSGTLSNTDSRLATQAKNTSRFLCNTEQSVVRTANMPEWAMCMVTGQMENCRPYELRHSSDVANDSVQALQANNATSATPGWRELSGRLAGYAAARYESFSSAREDNALQISAELQTFPLSSASALASLLDVIRTLQKQSTEPLTMGFVSPELLFFSVEELLARCETFPKLTPHRLLQGDGLPEAVVHITLVDSEGRATDFPYPPFFGGNPEKTHMTPQGHTVSATIQPVLTEGATCYLTGDDWRQLDSTFGALATFVAQVYLYNQDPYEALELFAE